MFNRSLTTIHSDINNYKHLLNLYKLGPVVPRRVLMGSQGGPWGANGPWAFGANWPFEPIGPFDP